MSGENDRTRLCKEEEEDERELQEYGLRLQYMSENCTESDMDVWRLIEEQQELLRVLKMRNEELVYSWGQGFFNLGRSKINFTTSQINN